MTAADVGVGEGVKVDAAAAAVVVVVVVDAEYLECDIFTITIRLAS